MKKKTLERLIQCSYKQFVYVQSGSDVSTVHFCSHSNHVRPALFQHVTGLDGSVLADVFVQFVISAF